MVEKKRIGPDVVKPTDAAHDDIVIAAGVAGFHVTLEIGHAPGNQRHALQPSVGLDAVELRNADPGKPLRQRLLSPGKDVNGERGLNLETSKAASVANWPRALRKPRCASLSSAGSIPPRPSIVNERGVSFNGAHRAHARWPHAGSAAGSRPHNLNLGRDASCDIHRTGKARRQ
jgi:hypothetical protein